MAEKVNPENVNKLVETLSFVHMHVPGSTTIGCWGILPGGYKVGYGESSCVNPDDFNENLGKTYSESRCLEDCVNNLFFAESYIKFRLGKDTTELSEILDV